MESLGFYPIDTRSMYEAVWRRDSIVISFPCSKVPSPHEVIERVFDEGRKQGRSQIQKQFKNLLDI